MSTTRDLAHDPEQTRKLYKAIRERKVRALHALIKKGVYVNGTAFDLARGHMPEQVEKLTDQQQNQIADVFYTLKENEVASWLKSMQLRNIQLPIAIRDEALLIVSERRGL